MWVIDPETDQFISVNKAACKHYGYPESEFMNMTISGIRKAENIVRESEEVQRVKKKS